VQPGGPKILVGGTGERKTLRLVARYADMWNGFGDPETVRHKIDVIEEHCRAVGRDPGEIVKTRLGRLIVTANDEETQARRAEYQALRGLDDEQLPSMLICGTPDAVLDRVQAYVDAGADGLMFSMNPDTMPEDVERAGRLLTDRFGG
jgi:alkanesulfonate monooxygenase SsuD/methylene tetrahydromethanopterin reductase-like flavin-dependent oxidoreductase (luciferase family)